MTKTELQATKWEHAKKYASEKCSCVPNKWADRCWSCNARFVVGAVNTWALGRGYESEDDETV